MAITGIRLTVLIGATVPLPAPRALVDAVQSVQVTEAAGQRSGFQIVVAAAGRSEVVGTMLAGGALDAGTRVILMVILGGTPVVVMDGLITRHDLVPSNAPGRSRLTLTGEDVSLAMDLDEPKGVVYPATGAEARVAAILARYGRYGIVPAIVPAVLSESQTPAERIPAQKGTDLAYLRLLAEESAHVFFVEPGPVPGTNVAYWGPDVRAGAPQPALGVGADAETNVESLSFAHDGLAATRYVVTVQDPRTRITLPVPVPDLGLLRAGLALRPATALRTRVLETANLTVTKAALMGLGQAARASDAVTGSGELDVLRYGHVLRPRRLVGVRGAGPAHDGTYFVRRVSHDIRPGSYRQSFEIARDGLGSLVPAVVP